MADNASDVVKTWKKRWTAAITLNKDWMEKYEVERCYAYWIGDQLVKKTDAFGNRIAMVNKIHPEVANNIPSIYYYRPYARLTAQPEYTDTPGTQIESDTQLLQDTVNHLIRDEETQFREATFLALKEAHWGMGTVEVGYSAEFVDAPTADKPPLKEKKDTKTGKPPVADTSIQQTLPGMSINPDGTATPDMGMAPGMPAQAPPMGAALAGPPAIDQESADLADELAALQEQLKSEKFYVKHIPCNQILVGAADMPITMNNDWIGYYEDVLLEDVKASPAYKNNKDLKAATGPETDKDPRKGSDADRSVGDKIRLYKIWDLRTKTRWVFAEGADKELLKKPYKRLPLKFLRFDVDPYHFLPRPLLVSKLGPQDEYNDSREYLRKIRKGTVPRYTYDEDAIDKKQMEKLESGEMGTYVPRHAGTHSVIEPVQQPSFSENAIQTLTLSDKEFADVGGVGGDAKVAQTKTATQAKIAETKNQTQDNFDRLTFSDFLSSVCRELLALAVENMSVDRVIALNVAPDAILMDPSVTAPVAQSFARINADILKSKESGIEWAVVIDIDSLSPVSEEEKFQKWMQGLGLLGNPVLARLFSVSPILLQQTLKYMGMRSANDQAMILGAMQQVVQMEAQLAAQGQNAAPGVSPQAGGGAPGAPKPPAAPQPGGPPRPPAASQPKSGLPPARPAPGGVH